jgi:hypothetical protein
MVVAVGHLGDLRGVNAQDGYGHLVGMDSGGGLFCLYLRCRADLVD